MIPQLHCSHIPLSLLLVIFNAYCYFLDQENNPAACATGPHVLVQQLSVINEQREIPECDQSAY